MKALILAAGYATRLFPLTKEYPKPLLLVGKRPIIDYIVDKLQVIEEINEIIVVTNSKFFSKFKQWRRSLRPSKRITLVDDLTKSLHDRRGAIGDMNFALTNKRIRDDILVIGGDNLFEQGLGGFLSFAREKKTSPIIGIYDIQHKLEAQKYGVVKLDSHGRVIDFQEKPEKPHSTLVAMCLYYFPKAKLKLIHEYLKTKINKHDATGFYIDWLRKRVPVYAFVFERQWYDIGHPNIYKGVKKNMEKRKYFFTSESVGEGHPDKVCDQISDAVLDEVLRNDKNPERSRVACETYVTMGLLIVGGEITTTAYVDIQKIARALIRDIGYNHPKYGFDYETCAIVNTIHCQSPDIAQGVNVGGAGDQGIMFGYACKETDEYMPLPITLAHRLVRRLAEVRRTNVLTYLGPDCKSQVTVEYDFGRPVRVDSVVLACQHTDNVLDKTGKHMSPKARQELIDVVAKPVLKTLIDKDTKYYVNQTGKFVVGGPQSDTGMTGRKIVVDTYGGTVPHGGGAFSGKDPTKVDRSAAYMCRYIAKNMVAAGLADKFLIQLAYVIGHSDPLSIFVDTYGTGKLSNEAFVKLIRDPREDIDIFF